MHAKSQLRESVLEAFELGYPSEDEIIERLGGPQQSREKLGRLWNCTDILPWEIREIIQTDWDGFENVHTYGVLARKLMEHSRAVRQDENR